MWARNGSFCGDQAHLRAPSLSSSCSCYDDGATTTPKCHCLVQHCFEETKTHDSNQPLRPCQLRISDDTQHQPKPTRNTLNRLNQCCVQVLLSARCRPLVCSTSSSSRQRISDFGLRDHSQQIAKNKTNSMSANAARCDKHDNS